MKHCRTASTTIKFFSLSAMLVFLLQGTASFAATAIGVPSALGPQSAGISSQMPVQQPHDSQVQLVQVIETAGTVEVRGASSDAWRSLKSGDILKPADMIRTGENSSAHIEFDGKIRMQILENSELTIEEAQRKDEKTRQTLLRLDIGKLRADVDKLEADSSFKIKTPTAVSAVRGTVLYLDVVRFAQGLAGIITSLYVDHGKVDFSSIEDEVNALFVEALHTSSIDGDGENSGSRELTEEERESLIQSFENAILKSGGNPQFGIENAPLPGGTPPGGVSGPNPGLSDAIRNLINGLINSRNEGAGIGGTPAGDDNTTLLGALKLTAFLLSEGVPDSGNFEYDLIGPEGGKDLGIVTDKRGNTKDGETILGSALAATTVAEVVQRIADLQAIRDAEKNELRNSLNSILDNQEFLKKDAEQERAFDAQTGKVFTDVHGNRVRTDQYIYHEAGSDTVSFLSLTLRTGEYQNGVTSFRFNTVFNQALPENTVLRDLPWNDYLNVVTSDDFSGRELEENTGSQLDWLYGSPRYDQYIVHSTADAPGLYPQSFLAEFKNPTLDSVTFTEDYTSPYSATFLNDHDSSVTRWVQGMERSGLAIREAGGVSIDRSSARTVLGLTLNTTTINGRSTVSLGDLREEGSQSEGLVDLGDLTALGAVENILNSADHPAYLSEGFRDQYLAIVKRRLKLVRTDYELNGVFLPIDNEGQLLDAPGFGIRGIRDLVRPNLSVNGGNYNLETILTFGRREGNEFVEDFRIDAIITPEIFGHYGIGGTRGLFFEDDEDEPQDR
ncbi:MAG: FecR domain-containing protein [Candidatus Omnitrophica bacterium]|nr:FecR domain-containing protein [Candidatus Omnitrophota bacterium]